MKKLLAFILLGMIIMNYGCQRKALPTNSKTTVIEKLVPVPVPSDSSALEALFACDSLNNVYLKALSEQKGNNVQTSFELKNGQVIYRTKYKHDTLYIPAKDSTVVKEVPTPYPVEVEKELTGFQSFLIWSGSIYWLILIIAIALKLFKVKIPSIR